MNRNNPWNLESNINEISAFRHERDWEKFHKPKELATAVSIEASELQELFLWRENESAREIQSDTSYMKRIQEEVADIAIYLLFLAHDLEINLSDAIADKLVLNERKYPVDRYKGIYKQSE